MVREIDSRTAGSGTVSDGRRAQLAERASVAASTSGLLGVSLPPLVVRRIDPTTNNAALITFERPSGLTRDPRTVGLTGEEREALVQRALEVTQALAPALGLEPGQPAEFVPDPNVLRASSGAAVVHLAQRYKSIPVFQAANAVRFDPVDELAALAGRTVSVA